MMQTWAGLIRGIGPTTHPVMPLRALCDSCAAAGLEKVKSLLATGNLLFESTLPEPEIQRLLAGAIQSYGLENKVILRRPGRRNTPHRARRAGAGLRLGA